MATTAAKFISQEDYDKGLQNYYQDLQTRTSRISSSIKPAPRTVSRRGSARRISFRGNNNLQKLAVSQYEAIQQKAYDTNVAIVNSEELTRINSLTPEQRYLAGDPNLRVQEFYDNRIIWEDTGKRVNGQKVEKIISYTKGSGPDPGSWYGKRVGKSFYGPMTMVGDNYSSFNSSEFSGQPHTTVDVSYNLTDLEANRGLSHTDWDYVSTSRALPRTAVRNDGTIFSPKAKYAGATDSTIRDRVTGMPLTLKQYNTRSLDPTVTSRKKVLAAGKGRASLSELRNNPQLFTSLPSQSIPTLSSGGLVLYGSTGKGYISGSNVAFPNEVKTPSFQKRTGFSERDAFASGVGLKIGEGSYNPSEIVNSFLDIKGGETLSQSAARVREDNIITQTLAEGERLKGNEWITQTKEVPVEVKGIAGSAKKEVLSVGKTTYQPSSLSGDFLSVPGGIYGVSDETQSDKQMSWIGGDLAKELGMTKYAGPKKPKKQIAGDIFSAITAPWAPILSGAKTGFDFALTTVGARKTKKDLLNYMGSEGITTSSMWGSKALKFEGSVGGLLSSNFQRGGFYKGGKEIFTFTGIDKGYSFIKGHEVGHYMDKEKGLFQVEPLIQVKEKNLNKSQKQQEFNKIVAEQYDYREKFGGSINAEYRVNNISENATHIITSISVTNQTLKKALLESPITKRWETIYLKSPVKYITSYSKDDILPEAIAIHVEAYIGNPKKFTKKHPVIAKVIKKELDTAKTQTKSVPVQVKQGKQPDQFNWIGQDLAKELGMTNYGGPRQATKTTYQPSSLSGDFLSVPGGIYGVSGETKKTSPPLLYPGATDFNFDVTKEKDFRKKYGEATAGDVVRKLQAEGKADLKDVDRTRELVYGVAGVKVEKARKEIKDTRLLSDIETGFYSEYGKDFGTFKETTLTPENKKRINELNTLVNTLETQTTKKLDGKTLKQYESSIKSQETSMLKSRDVYSTYIINLEGKSATKTQLKKIETLYDNSESDRKKYNLMLDKYGKRTDKINENVKKLDSYDDIIQQSNVEVKVRRDFIDELREKEKTLRETEPRFFDRIDRKPTGNKLKDTTSWIASAAIGSVNVIPKALTFRKSVKDYNLGLESYSELVKDYEKFDEIGKEKKPIPKQLDESLFYLTAKTSRPSEYDVAENIFAREGEGLKTTTKYFGGKARDYFSGLVRVGVMTRSFGGIFGGIFVPSYNKKNKADEKARAKHLEETVLLTKPNKSDKYMFDLKNVLTKQSLASKPYVKYGKEHMASFLTATGKTPSQYTDYVFTPPKSQIVGRVKKYAKLTLGDPDVTAVAATVALPFVYSKFGFSVFNPSSTVTALTAAQTPLGEAASELTTAGITVASENVLGATGTYMGLKPATVGKMERLGGVAGNIGSFFVPGRSQMALMGLNVKTIKKKPVESALLIGMGGGFKAVQSYGGAYVSRKLTSPAFAKLSRKAPYFKAGTYSLGKADLYQMGLTVPGKVATYGLGAIYGASIYTRAANAKNKYESRKIGKQVEQEFALLGLGGKLASSVRPVGAWEAEGLKRHGELFNYGPDGAGPFRTKLFGKGTSIKQYAKKMGLVEEPKSWEDGILIKLGLKQPTLKPEARELANLYIKAGYIKPTTTKFKSDQYRSTVAKIMKKYGVDVYLKGSKVGGENIRGFRNVQKSDYDIIFSGSKAKFSKFKTEIANAIIKQNPTLTQETLGTQLKVKTSTGKDVINVQYSKTKAPRSNIINKKGIRMLSEDAWIKDKYSIIAQLQQKPLLSNKQIAKLEQKLISNTNTIKTIQKGTKFKNKKQLNKLLKENEKIELQLKDKMKLKSLTAKQAGKLNQALRDVKAYENRELQITEKGLKKFEDRLTQFDALYKSSQRSVEDYGLNPKAKYRINPKEIDVFKKDAKPFDVFRDAMVRFKAKLGGSTTRLSAIGKGTRAKTLVSEPSDLDIYVKNQKAMRIFIEKGLKAKGYKLLKPEQKITKKNQFKIDQGKDGFEVILKDGKVQVHGEDMLYQNLFSVSSKSPFKPLFEKTPEGIMIPKYELQARRELFGAFGDSRASKDLPKFITGQKALALEMTTRRKITSKDYLSQLFGSKKTSGRSTKFKRSTSQKPAAEKYGREFERLNLRFLERSKDTLRMNLLQRKELSKLPELMKRVKGKPLFIKQQKGKQTEYKYKGLMPPLEPVTYAPSQKSSKRTKLNEGYKYFNEGGLYGGGYKKLDSSYKYTKDYKKYPGYDTYDPYKPYKPVKPYDGGGSYKPYKEYDEYTSYPTYPTYPTYNTYNTYSTYGYDYYKQTPPTTTPAKPPFGFGGGGRQRSRKKPMGYQIKTFGILKLYEEFNKPKIRKTKGNDKFKIL